MHQVGEASAKSFVRCVPPLQDDPPARDHDIADGRACAREQQMVERGLRRCAHHGGMRVIQHQPVGPAADGDGARGLADGLRAVLRGIAPQASAHMRLRVRGEYRAPFLAQALLILHPA